MALSLDGTTGITSDGGTPIIENLETTATGIAVTGVLTTTGNVGIGTASPRGAGGYTSLCLNNATTGAFIDFSTAGTRQATITGTAALFDFQSALTAPMTFSTNGANERMRITATGDVLVGTTSVFNAGKQCIAFNSASYVGIALNQTNANNSGTFLNFTQNGTTIGYITGNATTTTYATSSDYRLKEDWVAVADASTRVNALKPVNFAWKADGSRVDGFLAHELAEVVPEAVTGTKDAMRDEEYESTPAVLDDEGAVVTPAVMGTRSVPDYQGIDQSKLVPLLTAALQEALAKIDDLTARVSALEAV
jgi:hypothetical protein